MWHAHGICAMTREMTAVLEVRHLVKHFPGVVAVDDISFSIPPGICFGLLGPNGAGKTTTIEIIEGILPPTAGDILYKGAPKTAAFREEVGIQLQSTALLSFLTVRESLETFRSLYRTPMPLKAVIRLCQLEDILDRPNNKISGGQKQRLMLAVALVNDPDLIFLDEPTTGLDPQARRHLWEIVERIKTQGKTVVLTTHYMEEAQVLCETIAIVDRGKIIVSGPPEELVKRHCAGVTVSLPRRSVRNGGRDLTDTVTQACPDVKLVEMQNRFEIMTHDVGPCLTALLETGTDLSRITVRPQTLEDLFLKLTGRHLRQ